MKIFKKTARLVRRATFYDAVKGDAKYIKDLGRELMNAKSSGGQTAEHVTDLGLDAEHIAGATKAFKRLLMIFLSIGALVLLYSLYKFVEGSVAGGLVALAVVAICLAQAFKYHFWLYQIRIDRLGCTWREWLDDLLKQGGQ